MGLRSPAGAAGHDQDIEARRSLKIVVGDDPKPVGQYRHAAARCNGANLDIGPDAPRHRQHPEGGKIDRLHVVIDQNPEQHVTSFLAALRGGQSS
jgi:hypothetical protein